MGVDADEQHIPIVGDDQGEGFKDVIENWVSEESNPLNDVLGLAEDIKKSHENTLQEKPKRPELTPLEALKLRKGESVTIKGHIFAVKQSIGNDLVLTYIDRAVGRNDPCPCGSGKKYKKCHGG